MPATWWDANAPIWQPPPQPQGQPGAELGGAMPPQAPAPRQFDLAGAQVHGRAADPKDANDLLWLASQQPGFDISSNDAAKRTFQDIINPLFKQYQGVDTTLGGKNLDRITLPGGRTLDFIGNAGEADTSKRRMWVGDSALERPKAALPTLGSLGQMPDLGSTLQQQPNPYMGAPPSMDAGAPPMPAGDRPMMPTDGPNLYAPQTVQGPQAMDLKALMAQKGVPGFATGVQNFTGGPALVGEQGPELLNLPKGSDVIPLGGASTGGGGLPGFGTPGAMPGFGDPATSGFQGKKPALPTASPAMPTLQTGTELPAAKPALPTLGTLGQSDPSIGQPPPSILPGPDPSIGQPPPGVDPSIGQPTPTGMVSPPAPQVGYSGPAMSTGPMGGSAQKPTLGSLGQPAPLSADIASIAPPQGGFGSQPVAQGGWWNQTPMKPQGIPGFANGVQNFQGGPAIVGERGPELLNVKGQMAGPMNAMTNVAMPLGGGGGLPPIGSASIESPINFGNGGGLPQIGTPANPNGAVNLGGGGGMPPIGQPGGGPFGAINFGGGGSMPAVGTPGGGPGAPGGPQGGGPGGYQYNPMAAPQNYNPAAVGGPDRLTLGSINQPGAVNAQTVNAQQVNPGERVNAQNVNAYTVQTPQQVAAERIQGPEALRAQQLANAPEQRNLTAAELQLDPSYQFRLQQGLGALQSSAAAKGLLHTGGTAKGLQDYAAQSASQEYAAANARNLGVQQQNFQNQATVAGANNAANAQAYGLTNQFQQQAALANQQTGLQAQLANQQTGLQAGMFNAGAQNQTGQFNAANALQSGMFNSGQQQQAGLANASNNLQGQLANQSANLNAGQFNAQMGYNTQNQNTQNQLAAYNAYQPLNQQNQQFNAQQNAAANQNNFANQFSVNQANNAGSLGAFNANTQANLGYGQLALGNRSADQSYALGQGNLALGNRSADQSYDLGLRNNALGYYGAQNSYNLGLGNLGVSQGQLGLAQQGQAYNQDLNTFNTNYGIYRDNAASNFDQNYRLAQLGAGAAQNYGNQAGALYSGQGNANGAAAINQGNAYAGALGQLGNIAGQAGAYYANPENRNR